MKKNTASIIINASFLFILLGFFINQNANIISDDGGIENRSKIKKPPLDIASLDAYPKEYEAYYDDNFNLRSSFLSSFNSFNKEVFKNHVISNSFIRGKEDFIFSKKRFKKSRKYFTPKELNLIKNELEYRDSVFRADNRRMIIFVLPGKYTSEHEKLPPFFRSKEDARAERVMKYLQQNSHVLIYSLDGFLQEKMRPGDIFFKYDTHWNNLGAYWAYYFISEKISEFYPALKPRELSDFEVVDTIKTNGDIARNLGFKLHDKNYSFHPLFKSNAKKVSPKETYFSDVFMSKKGVEAIESGNSDLPRAVIVRDSFTIQLFPFIKNSFGSALFLWDKWTYQPHYEIVSDYDPDLVLYFMSEGNLEKFLPKDLMDTYLGDI